MSIAKVIEVTAEAPSIEKAMEHAVAEAGDSVRKIQNVYLRDAEGIVENGKIKTYRVNTKITFKVDGTKNKKTPAKKTTTKKMKKG